MMEICRMDLLRHVIVPIVMIPIVIWVKFEKKIIRSKNREKVFNWLFYGFLKYYKFFWIFHVRAEIKKIYSWFCVKK
jgi:hypothetical protein